MIESVTYEDGREVEIAIDRAGDIFETETEAVVYGWYMAEADEDLDAGIDVDELKRFADIDQGAARESLMALGRRNILFVFQDTENPNNFKVRELDERDSDAERTVAERQYAWDALIRALKSDIPRPFTPKHPQFGGVFTEGEGLSAEKIRHAYWTLAPLAQHNSRLRRVMSELEWVLESHDDQFDAAAFSPRRSGGAGSGGAS